MLIAAFVDAFRSCANDLLAERDPDSLLVLSLAALGLNILTGYAGQLSLGIGRRSWRSARSPATTSMLRIAGMPLLVAFALGGVCAALVGIVFGLPSLRIRGLLSRGRHAGVAVLHRLGADKFGWFTNYSRPA